MGFSFFITVELIYLWRAFNTQNNKLDMTLNFNYQKRESSPFVRAIIYHEGERKAIYVCPSPQWDSSKQRSGIPEVDMKLAEIERKFNEYISKAPRPDVHECEKLIKGQALVKGLSSRLSEVFEIFIRDMKNILDKKTIAKYATMRDQIEAFEIYRGRPVQVEGVNKDLFLELIEYLIEEQDNVNKTILRKLKTIRTVMNYAVEEGMVNHIQWKRRIDLKDSKASRVPLNKEERDLLWNYTTTDLTKRRVVDAFLFDMYSGLRYEDLKKLSSSHIFYDNINGVDICYINMTATKGVTEATIPVLAVVQPILDKYKNFNGPLFGLDYNSETNRILKEVCKELGMNRMIEVITIQGASVTTEYQPLYDKISWHYARYTYVEVMERSGLQTTYIQHNLNHKKLETTNTYIRSEMNNRIIETRRVVGR